MKNQIIKAGDREDHGKPLKRRAVFPIHRLKLTEPDAQGRRSFEGYASVFGNRDAHGDIVVKGAFERTLRERPDIKVLWQHDPDRPIGKDIGAFEDDYGLRVRGQLTPTDFVNGEALPLLEDGVVNGLSIGYSIVEYEVVDSDHMTWFLKDLDLWEYSPVTFPANELATVTVVKQLDGRAGRHADALTRHAKALVHELEGYYGNRPIEDVELESLRKAVVLLAGKLPGGGHKAADAQENEVLSLAYTSGFKDGMSFAKELSHVASPPALDRRAA